MPGESKSKLKRKPGGLKRRPTDATKVCPRCNQIFNARGYGRHVGSQCVPWDSEAVPIPTIDPEPKDGSVMGVRFASGC